RSRQSAPVTSTDATQNRRNSPLMVDARGGLRPAECRTYRQNRVIGRPATSVRELFRFTRMNSAGGYGICRKWDATPCVQAVTPDAPAFSRFFWLDTACSARL